MLMLSLLSAWFIASTAETTSLPTIGTVMLLEKTVGSPPSLRETSHAADNLTSLLGDGLNSVIRIRIVVSGIDVKFE